MACLAAQEPVVLASFGGGQPARVQGHGADGGPDARQRAAHGVEERGRGVREQVPSVGHLSGVRASARCRRSVGAAAIARNHLDPGMCRQPVFDGAGGAIRQQVDDAPAPQIADDGAVAVSAPPPSRRCRQCAVPGRCRSACRGAPA